MKDANTSGGFLSIRMLWGFLAGIVSWLVLALFLKMHLGYSPAISIIIAMLISRFYEPKRLAGLSAGIGVLAGVVYGMQSVFQVFSTINFERIVFSPVFIGLTILFSGLLFAFVGFVIGTIAWLYKKGSIF